MKLLDVFDPLLIDALKLPTQEDITDVSPYSSPRIGEASHQFVMLIKPELTLIQQGVDVRGVIEILDQILSSFGIVISGIRVLPSAYLLHNGIIPRNYPVLNAISCQGLAACSPSVISRVNQNFGGEEVLGGHQILKEHVRLSAGELDRLFGRGNPEKYGHGAYVSRVIFEGSRLVVLNGFHPAQCDWLTTPSGVIVALSCSTFRSWRDLHTELVGHIDPRLAVDGSIRKELYKRREDFHLLNFDIAHNGVHISPGPVEAAAQTQLFFGTSCDAFTSSDTLLGCQLLEDGISEVDVQMLINGESPWTHEANYLLYESTEDLDSDEVRTMLAKLAR